MLNKDILDLLNEQINKELYSAYLYLDIANYYSDEGLKGFENWFFIQAQEEKEHAMLFRTYLMNNDEKVTLSSIEAPNKNYFDFESPLSVTLEHENSVTESINNIYSLAHSIKDFRTMQFLNWFIKEQGEEEKTISDIIKRFELFGNDSKGLYLLDEELSARVFTAPDITI